MYYKYKKKVHTCPLLSLQVVIPRSMDSAHMAENLAVLTSLRLGYHEMRRIDSLDGSKD